jgi:hypothetical protein
MKENNEYFQLVIIYRAATNRLPPPYLSKAADTCSMSTN